MSAIEVLHQHLDRAAQRAPEKVALVAGTQRVRYRDLCRDTWSLARWLSAAGVRQGDRVVVFASNTVATAISFWAVLAAGGVVVMVHPATRRDKLAYILADSGAAVLVSEAGLASVFLPAMCAARAREDGPTNLRLLVIGELPPGVSQGSAFDAAIASGRTDARALPVSRAHDLAALIYTSGSTGEPKAVMLTHRNMVAATASIASYLELHGDDVIIGVLPFSFDYGLYQLILSVSVGARLVLERSFDLPGQVLSRIASERVTVLPGVPTLFAMLARLGDLSRWDLSSIRTVTSTAAALGLEQIRWLTATFPAARVYSMYGLTECKRCTYLPPADLARKPGSVGIPIPGNEIWLVDEDDRRVPANEVGQLVVRGPTVMAGYWRRPDETAGRLRRLPTAGVRAAFDGERVLYTGDLCRMDDEGYLYFVRRMDDVIKSRGEKVSPAEVEAALRSVPSVLDAAVVGVPDAVLGEAVKAFVVADPSASLTAATLQTLCRERLEPFMVPREIVIVDELPRTPHGKIERRALV